MGLISPTLPTAGQPRGGEETDVRNALTAVLALLNGNVDAANVADASLTLGEMSSSFVDNVLPWQVPVPIFAPQTNTGFTAATGSTFAGGVRMSSTNAQNDQIGWDLTLAAGAWDLIFYTGVHTDQGEITVSIDGTTVGTVDTYNATPSDGNQKSITGIAVATSGKHRLLFKMASKNASSSAFTGRVENGIVLRRTA